MNGIKLNHFLSGEELDVDSLKALLDLAQTLKAARKKGLKLAPFSGGELSGKNIVLLFEKPSLRTHISFSVAVQELGGWVTESYGSNRKHEEPEDLIRVLSGYCHGVMVRTHEHSFIERMAKISTIPIINGLSDSHHPCQILADLLALKEKFHSFEGLTLSLIGDGNNILHSLLLLLPPLGIHLHYCCPKGYQPDPLIVARARERLLAQSQKSMGSITSHVAPLDAVCGTNAIYTDVWTSMGFEKEQRHRELAFQGYQLNIALYQKAAPGAAIMHCLPMIREKEITSELIEHPDSLIFQQAENRLHVQKALLQLLFNGENIWQRHNNTTRQE